MERRFGSAPVGIAGENIIIDGPAVTIEDLGDGLVIEARDGTEIRLERPRVAAPRVEFTSFMLGIDRVASLAEIAGPLGDLDDGRHGLIVAADDQSDPVMLERGAMVYQEASRDA